MKKTISVSITEVPFDNKVHLSISVATWSDGSSNIVDFTEIHKEKFDTMDEALDKAVSVNYEHEQRMDNLTGGNNES